MMKQRVYGLSPPGQQLDVLLGAQRGGLCRQPAGYRRQRPDGLTERRQVDQLRFYSAACSLPNPTKKSEGEDAHMIAPCGTALAVADGVGGWTEIGIDSGEYSRELCKNAARYVANRGANNPREIMRYAYDNSKATGTSTCCVLTIQDNVLRAANLGDSGFLVLRQTQQGLKFVMQSEEQQHDFNTPRQLGTNSLDMPHDAHRYELQLHPGDIVIAGTDGLFDNLSVDDIMHELEKHIGQLRNKASKLSATDEETLTKLADHIATTAYLVSKDQNVTTPFSNSAAKYNIEHRGGKMDDITIIVAMVAPISGPETLNEAPRSSSSNSNNGVFYLPPSAFHMQDDAPTAAPRGFDRHESSDSADTIYTSYSSSSLEEDSPLVGGQVDEDSFMDDVLQ